MCKSSYPSIIRQHAKKLDRYIFLFVLVLLVASCASVELRSTKIETLVPSERRLPISDSLNIAIVASIYPDTRTEEHKKYGFPNDSMMIITTAFALKAKLEESPKFSSYYFPVYESPRTDSVQNIKQLDSAVLDQIARDANADYLLSVEYQTVNISYKSGKALEPDEGLFNYVQAVVPYDVMFRLYDVNNKKMIDEKLIIDTLFAQETQPFYETVQDALHRLPEPKELVLDASRKAGELYAERVSPKWVEEIRFFYTDGSQTMNRAAKYCEEQDWSNAIELWLDYVENTDPQKAATAAFNMALGCEMTGNYELALEWLDIARKKDARYENISKQYEKVLKERIDEKAKIDSEL